MKYGIKKYNEENKIQIRVESTHGNESVKTFSIYSDHGNGKMMIRSSRGVLFSTDGNTIRSTAFKSRKMYDVLEIKEREDQSDNERANREIEAVCKQAEKDLAIIADAVASRESDHTIPSSIAVRNALLNVKSQMDKAINTLSGLVVEVDVNETEDISQLEGIGK